MFRSLALRSALLVFGFAAVVTAAGCGGHCRSEQGKADWVTNRIANKLDLNDAQKAKLEELKVEILTLRSDLRKGRNEDFANLMSQATAPELDQAKLQALFDTRKETLEKSAPTVIAKLAEFHKTLNPEQKEKLVEIMKKFQKHHED